MTHIGALPSDRRCDHETLSHLRIENLRFVMEEREILAIDSFSLCRGETVAIMGPNGAGKSSFMRCLALLEPLSGGKIFFNNEELSLQDPVPFRRRTAVLFQQPLLFDTTVAENVSAGLYLRGISPGECRKRAGHWLERLRISHLADRSARALSGGEARRVSIARAMAVDPEILFLDEPFTAIDAPSRGPLLLEMAELLDEHRITTIVITHELTEAKALAHRLGIMIGGRIRQIAPIADVIAHPIDQEVHNLVHQRIFPDRVPVILPPKPKAE